MNILVEKYIKELLFDYDCVIVPNFGGFISTYMGAEISIAKNKISPARKQIKFNDKLTTNDSLLIDFIAENENISILDAYKLVEVYIEDIKSQIEANSQYTIESLGRIYLNEDKIYCFEQYLRFNYLKESFGLPDLYFKPIDRTQDSKTINKLKKQKLMASTIENELEDDDAVNQYNQNEEESDDYEDDDLESVEQKKTENLAIYYIMAILALVLTAGTAYYLNMDKSTYAIGSFSPLSLFGRGEVNDGKNVDNKLLPSESEDQIQSESDASEDPESQASSNESSNATNSQNEVVASAAKVSNEVEFPQDSYVNSKTGRYYIIVGGFKSKRKASSFLTTMINDGNPSKVIDSYDESGLYRVAVADYATYEEAATQKKAFSEKYGEELWVLNY